MTGAGALERRYRRLLPKRRWQDGAEFRRDFFATEPERTEVTLCADGAG